MPVTLRQLRLGLARLGVVRGKWVMVHSSLSSFGQLEGGAAMLVSALKEAVTEEGLLLMPAFTYGSGTFSQGTSPAATGAVSEEFRKSTGVVRSKHPTHSICAWGESARWATSEHEGEGAFGPLSPLGRFYNDGLPPSGDILLIGVDFTACSVIHLAQEVAEVAYLNRTKVVERAGEDGHTLPAKVRRAGCSLGFNKIRSLVEPFTRTGIIGDSLLMLIPSHSIVRAAVRLLQNDQGSLCCARPECFACNEARTMIAKARS